MSARVRRDILKWIIQSALGLVAYGLILFLAANRIDWIWGEYAQRVRYRLAPGVW